MRCVATCANISVSTVHSLHSAVLFLRLDVMVVELDARCKKIEMFVGAHAVNVVLAIHHRYRYRM